MSPKAQEIAIQVVMYRTRLLELLTAIRSANTEIEHRAAEKRAQEFIEGVVKPVLENPNFD